MSKEDYCIIPVVYKRRTVEQYWDMRDWLYKNIDPQCFDLEDWHVEFGHHEDRYIWFAHEKDATLFALIWC